MYNTSRKICRMIFKSVRSKTNITEQKQLNDWRLKSLQHEIFYLVCTNPEILKDGLRSICFRDKLFSERTISMYPELRKQKKKWANWLTVYYEDMLIYFLLLIYERKYPSCMPGIK
jgi:hypothetical protein